MDKKRIAFCFYGQLRFYELIRDHYPNFLHNVNEYDIDLFISTWNDFDYVDDLFEHYVDYNLINMPTYIREIENNSPKFMYLLSDVVSLKKKHEVKMGFAYDYVVILRPDYYISIEDFLNSIDILIKSGVVDNFIVSNDEMSEMSGEPAYLSDYMFIGDSVSIDIHSTMYNFFVLSRKYKLLDTKLIYGGHWLHAYYVNYNKFDKISINSKGFLIRPVHDIEVFRKYINSSELKIKLHENRKNNKIINKSSII